MYEFAALEAQCNEEINCSEVTYLECSAISHLQEVNNLKYKMLPIEIGNTRELDYIVFFFFFLNYSREILLFEP